MTKMDYDEKDREVRDALQKGIQDYKKEAETQEARELWIITDIRLT